MAPQKHLPAPPTTRAGGADRDGHPAGVKRFRAAGECGDGWGLESVSILLIVMQQTIM